jgi:predicted kinase
MSFEGAVFALPADALVLLVGPAGAGKSTFARRQFARSSVLSSDGFRDVLSGDPADQRSTVAAFRLLHAAARERLARGLLTVVDATNVLRSARDPLVSIAEEEDRPRIALVFDIPLVRCLEQNAARAGRVVPAAVVRRQYGHFVRARLHLAAEGLVVVHLTAPVDASPTPIGGPESGPAWCVTGADSA